MSIKKENVAKLVRKYVKEIMKEERDKKLKKSEEISEKIQSKNFKNLDYKNLDYLFTNLYYDEDEHRYMMHDGDFNLIEKYDEGYFKKMLENVIKLNDFLKTLTL